MNSHAITYICMFSCKYANILRVKWRNECSRSVVGCLYAGRGFGRKVECIHKVKSNGRSVLSGHCSMSDKTQIGAQSVYINNQVLALKVCAVVRSIVCVDVS